MWIPIAPTIANRGDADMSRHKITQHDGLWAARRSDSSITRVGVDVDIFMFVDQLVTTPTPPNLAALVP